MFCEHQGGETTTCCNSSYGVLFTAQFHAHPEKFQQLRLMCEKRQKPFPRKCPALAISQLRPSKVLAKLR